MTSHVTMQPEEDGWIVSECPALPGCVSQGHTEAEALENIKEAVAAWLSAEDQKAAEDMAPFLSLLCLSVARQGKDLLYYLSDKGIGDPKIRACLRDIKDLHRNQLMHSEVSLGMDQAIALWGIAQSAVTAMLRAIPDKGETPMLPGVNDALISLTNWQAGEPGVSIFFEWTSCRV